MGASLQNFGKGILPSVEKISTVQWVAIQLTGAIRLWVGGDRLRAPANSCREGCLEFLCIHPLPYLVYLSHALRTADCIHCIFAYIWGALFWQLFKRHTLEITSEWGQKVRDVVTSRNQNIIVSNPHSYLPIPAKERYCLEFTKLCHPISQRQC